MDNIHKAATERTPEVVFDFTTNHFTLNGECYPEDVSSFFDPLMENLEKHFTGLEGIDVQFSFELIYFNSSTAKVLMTLFETLELLAKAGNQVTVRWVYEEGDDNMQELGEEFSEDLKSAQFLLEECAAG